MQSYTFHLYRDDGALLGTAIVDLESDEEARAYIRDIFHSYPSCDELEVWETPRYIAQGRRRKADSAKSSPPVGKSAAEVHWRWTASGIQH